MIGDVGQDAFEEIDVGLAANYGWPCCEGTARRTSIPRCDSGTAAGARQDPSRRRVLLDHRRLRRARPGAADAPRAATSTATSARAGLRSVDLANPASDAAVGLSVDSLSSFGEDACGRILVVSLAGPVYRLVDGAPSACPSPPRLDRPGADTRACSLSARVTGVRSVRRPRRLTVALRADEACRATVSARVRGVASFRRHAGGAGARSAQRRASAAAPRGDEHCAQRCGRHLAARSR